MIWGYTEGSQHHTTTANTPLVTKSATAAKSQQVWAAGGMSASFIFKRRRSPVRHAACNIAMLPGAAEGTREGKEGGRAYEKHTKEGGMGGREGDTRNWNARPD